MPVFGVGEQDGRYYVMQFIPGMGLDVVLDELKRSGGEPDMCREPRASNANGRSNSPAASAIERPDRLLQRRSDSVAGTESL